MSKKDKSKFHKRIKAQILQQMAQTQAQEKVGLKPTFQPQAKPKGTELKPATTAVQPTSQAVAININLQNLPQIKYDLKKTAVVVATLVSIIAALYFLDFKYNILISFGNIIFRVLHINQ